MTAAENTSAIGHAFQIGQLWQLASAERIAQASIFAGPQGIGKRRIALDLAAEILARGSGRSVENEKKLVWSGNHPDLHVLIREEEKKEITVDRMREFCSSMRLNPYQGRTSVWIIDNADEMNISASNSLLMPLEEPPAHAKIILITSEIHRIVSTIVSRCQPVYFGELAQADLTRVLAGLAEAAGEKLDSKTLAELVAFTGGSLQELELAPFLDQRTGAVTDGPGLIQHLKKVISAAKSVRSKIDSALRSGTPVAMLTSVAAELAADKENPAMTWRVLKQFARDRINSGTPKQISGWAAALESAVKSEQLVTERNLSPQLHLTELLLQFGDAAAH